MTEQESEKSKVPTAAFSQVLSTSPDDVHNLMTALILSDESFVCTLNAQYAVFPKIAIEGSHLETLLYLASTAKFIRHKAHSIIMAILRFIVTPPLLKILMCKQVENR